MKTKSTITAYIVHSIVMAVLLVTAQVSLAGSATWLSFPQDSAWENANNWTPGGPPNGPSDIATFAQSSQRDVNVSTSEEVNSIVFASASASFTLHVSPFGASGGELIISGTGVSNNSSVLQTFVARNEGQIIFTNASTAASAHMSIVNGGFSISSEDSTGSTIFNNTSSAAGASIENFDASGFDGDIGRTIFNGASTADHASIRNYGPGGSHGAGGQIIFNDTSTAANASIDNGGTGDVSTAESSLTTFNDTSTAGHATITNQGGLGLDQASSGGATIFDDSSTADGAILIANGGMNGGGGGAILFNGASTGGTARVEVFDNGYLNISGHQSGVTIGSIEGSGNVSLGVNNLRVGTRNINTSFSGVISSGSGSLAKIGSGYSLCKPTTALLTPWVSFL
jgi:Negative regulator of sigma E activity